MFDALTYKKELDALRGKTIAVIYIFENEEAPGFQHYWIWKSDIISGWLNAIQELECVPYIMDVRTFIQKSSNCTLPHIDYILNLNCGNYNLSCLGLVPAMCSFLDIPCIPCNATTIIMGENKNISNLIAASKGLLVPQSLPESSAKGIFRPLNLGSSKGIQIGKINTTDYNGLYQEFIPGYDVTIPILYNPLIGDLDLLPPLIYLPNSKDPFWIYDIYEKYAEVENFIKMPINIMENSVLKKLIDFAHAFPIQTFGRIDARIKCSEKLLSEDVYSVPFNIENLYFIEINPMPTIEYNDSFEMAFETAKATPGHSFYESISNYFSFVKKPTMIGFILSSSVIAMSRNQRD